MRYRVINIYGQQYGRSGFESLTDAILAAEALLSPGSVFDTRKNRYVWQHGRKTGWWPSWLA